MQLDFFNELHRDPLVAVWETQYYAWLSNSWSVAVYNPNWASYLQKNVAQSSTLSADWWHDLSRWNISNLTL